MKYTFPLKKTVGWTALNSHEDCAAASRRLAMYYLSSTSGLSGVGKVSPVHFTGKSLDRFYHHLSGSESGQLSPRSSSLSDQRVKVQFEKLNVECGNLQVQCPKSDVGSENVKDKC